MLGKKSCEQLAVNKKEVWKNIPETRGVVKFLETKREGVRQNFWETREVVKCCDTRGSVKPGKPRDVGKQEMLSNAGTKVVHWNSRETEMLSNEKKRVVRSNFLEIRDVVKCLEPRCAVKFCANMRWCQMMKNKR